jgi:hypothetical protein
MKKVDFAIVIQETISRCSQNRIGEKPPVFVTHAPALTRVPWPNRTAEEFVRRFLYEALFTCDADAAVEVSLRRRTSLNDLNSFLGIKPSYWIQLRVAGRGIRVAENLIDELFAEVGFRTEEWVGIAGSSSMRLGIFGTIDGPNLKLAFSLETLRRRQKCDLLLPIADHDPAPELLASNAALRSAQL